jgi:TPR repeat protein
MRYDVLKFASSITSIAAFCSAISVLPAESAVLAEDQTIKIELALAPPKGDTGIKCVQSQSIAELENHWSGWDGKRDPGVSLLALRIDGKRLAAADASHQFETAERIFQYLIHSKDAKIATQSKIDLARLYVDAERLNATNIKQIIGPIESGAPSRNATAILVVGEIYEKGLGVPADFDKAISYYKSASQLGQADALLRLATFKLEGKITDFSLDPTVALKLAMKNMVENEVPDPCFGIKRIARMYAKGTGLIRQNHELAAAWYQVAADSGDPDSAWTVARYHMIGENVKTDIRALRKYLSLAAELGVTQAMLEMGRAYEDGSLFPKNLAEARMWYTKAAKAGLTSAQLRLSRLEGVQPEEQEQLLEVVTASPQAPVSALLDYAKVLTGQLGRQTGGKEAEPVLQRAVKLGSGEAAVLLAKYEILSSKTGGISSETLEQVESAAAEGQATALALLADMHTCSTNGQSDFELAQTLRRAVTQTDANLGPMVKDAMQDLENTSHLSTQIGLFRSAATRALPDGLAMLLFAMQRSGVAANDQAYVYWLGELAKSPQAQWRLARLTQDKQSGLTDATFISTMAKAASEGSDLAAIDLAKALLSQKNQTADQKSKIHDLLLGALNNGRGEALALYFQFVGEAEATKMVQSENMKKIANEKGDARFSLILAERTTEIANKRAWLQLATRISDCSFADQLRLDQALVHDNPELVWQRMDVLEELASESGTDKFRIGDVYDAIGTKSAKAKAMDAYQTAALLGNEEATRRVLAAYMTPGSSLFSLESVRSKLPSILASADKKKIYATAEAMRRMITDDKMRAAYSDVLEPLYLKAAELEHAGAIREYALSLQQGTFTKRDPGAAVTWFKRASKLGDKIASRQLAKAYLTGFGVAQSLPQAAEYFTNASKQGDKASAKILPSLMAMISPKL